MPFGLFCVCLRVGELIFYAIRRALCSEEICPNGHAIGAYLLQFHYWMRKRRQVRSRYAMENGEDCGCMSSWLAAL